MLKTKFKPNTFYKSDNHGPVVLLVRKILEDTDERTRVEGKWFEVKDTKLRDLDVDQEVVIPKRDEHLWKFFKNY